MDMVGNHVEEGVPQALADDPRVPYPDEIAVDSFRGAVTLRGDDALEHATSLSGVTGITKEIRVVERQ